MLKMIYMASTKIKTAWFCTECGNESSKWMGQCPACGAWNTMVEEKVATGAAPRSEVRTGRADNAPVPLSEAKCDAGERIQLNLPEFERLLGGGLVRGSLVLLGGEPGIGKSTLSLQIPLLNPSLKVLYATGEESVSQVKMRADRIGGNQDNCFIFSETQMELILKEAKRLGPDLVIVDSV